MSRGGRTKAVLTLNRVNGRYRRGRLSTPEKLREAINDVDRAVAALKTLEVTPLRLGDIARAHQLAASLYTELGQHDDAIDRMVAAQELFEEAGASGLDYGRFLHDFAVTWLHLNSGALAIEYAEKALEVFTAAHAAKEARDARAFIASLQSHFADGPSPDIAAIRRELQAASRDERAEIAQLLVLAILSSGDALEHVDELHRSMRTIATAIEDGNARLAAELIETSRLQVEPTHAGLRESSIEPLSTRSRVAELHAVSVGGASVLADHYRVLSPKAVALEDMIAATGAADAQWWGTWTNNERVYWVVRLYGRWSAGTIAVTPGSRISSLLQEALELSMLPRDNQPAEILAGPWCRSASDEEDFAADIGDALIPAPLQLALEDAVDRGEPLSLVVSGNLFAYLPVPLLAVSRERGATPIRVIEGAVLRVAAPAILTQRVADREAPRADLFPIVAACVGPRGDLKFSRAVPRGARTVLGESDTPDGIPATRENLSASLPSPGGYAGIFYYSGHAAAEGLGGDHEDALVLAVNETLSAAALFESAQTGSGPFFPSRTMLSACSSSGAAGAGAGEWLGLTAAVLWKGARQVLATNWPIWDTPFTSEFDLTLIRLLQRHGDAAAALRLVQLEALESWRESIHDFTGYEGEGMSREDFSLPFPLIWAAYSCVGVRDR